MMEHIHRKTQQLMAEADEAFGKPEPTHVTLRSDMKVERVHHMGDTND